MSRMSKVGTALSDEANFQENNKPQLVHFWRFTYSTSLKGMGLVRVKLPSNSTTFLSARH